MLDRSHSLQSCESRAEEAVMYYFRGRTVDMDQMRTELQTMGTDELLRFIEAITAAKAHGREADNNLAVPFDEATAEWKRRV